jgi:hypothetical protein
VILTLPLNPWPDRQNPSLEEPLLRNHFSHSRLLSKSENNFRSLCVESYSGTVTERLYIVAPTNTTGNPIETRILSCVPVCCPSDSDDCTATFPTPTCVPKLEPVQYIIPSGESKYMCIVRPGTDRYQYAALIAGPRVCLQ